MPRLLAFAASLRRESLNRKLVVVAARIARARGADVDVAEMRDFDMPLYDGDLDRERGMPPGGLELKRRVEWAHGILIAVPEYNYSIPGVLKNAFDWVSRARPMPWRGKSVYLMSASPSPMGGIRGLWQTRIPFEGCGAIVFPDMFALANAQDAFDEGGILKPGPNAERLDREITGFVHFADAVAPLCGGGRPATKTQAEIAAAIEEESEVQAAE